jgi:hypothetical protein
METVLELYNHALLPCHASIDVCCGSLNNPDRERNRLLSMKKEHLLVELSVRMEIFYDTLSPYLAGFLSPLQMEFDTDTDPDFDFEDKGNDDFLPLVLS